MTLPEHVEIRVEISGSLAHLLFGDPLDVTPVVDLGQLLARRSMAVSRQVPDALEAVRDLGGVEVHRRLVLDLPICSWLGLLIFGLQLVQFVLGWSHDVGVGIFCDVV